MRILHSIRSVNPDGGGVVEALKQFSLAHRELGHQVEILSLDDPGETFVRDFPLRVHALGSAKGKYGYAPKLLPWLKDHRCDFDCVIIDGLWQYNVFGVWRALHGTDTPYFVFPHGMLDPWFKRTYPLKHLKKWLYWPWAEYRVLRDATRVFFTCEEEQRLARESFWLYRVNEEIASLGLQAAPDDAAAQCAAFQKRFPELNGKRVLLFLARLHVKKGCDLLIEAFAESARKDPQLHLVMAGPDQTGWQTKLQQRCAELGIANRVTWTGMISGEMKWGAIRSAEAFILPSHQENFGLAVVEALACGVPVWISNKVNIWREIEADGAGVVATDTLEGARQLIENWRETKSETLVKMRVNATASFARRFEIGTAAKHLLTRLRAAGVGDTAPAGNPVAA